MNVTRLRVVPDLPLVGSRQYTPPPAMVGGGERRPRIDLGSAVAIYDYPDARGRVLMRKLRYAPPCGDPPKAFRMQARIREGHVWLTPKMLDANHPEAEWPQYFNRLLYRLPALLAATAEDGPVFWVAGEKDADAVASLGVVAVTHHQGEAVGPSAAQAEHFRGWRGGVYLVADRDTTGAFDVVRRFDLLRAVGVPAKHLRIVVGAVEGKGCDAFDHVAAGGGLDDFRTVPVDRAREIAATSTAQRRSRDGYGWSR
jgi:hypothetical protein